MNDWWQTLTDASRLFWGIAIAASVFQLLMFASSLFSGGDLDHSLDTVEEGSAAEGVKLLSVRAITAFFVGFGWAGALALGKGSPALMAVGFASIVGVVFMAVIFLIMKLLVSLKADGTLNYQNAIGSTAHVYVTIPAQRSGQGQIELMLQGRLITTSAVTDFPKTLPPQTSVIVRSVEGGTLLVVEPSNV